MRISLLGYMASGKTTVGKKLAKELCLDFVDLDDYIEQQETLNISEIFKKRGEVYFRDKENECLSKILNERDDIILSLGGGTPCYQNNIELLNQQTTTVYLKVSVPVICQRLVSESEHRPIVASMADEAIPAFVQKHLKDREQYYSKSHFSVSAENQISEIIKEITSKLGV